MTRIPLWLLLGGAAVLPAQASYAHAIEAPQAEAAASEGGALASAPQDGADADRVEEIVVTAQRRSQNLQDVPVTVTAIAGSALTGLGGSVSTRDLPQLVPGLVFNKTLASGTPFLRGVGQGAGAPGLEPAVAFYFDGVYIPTAGANVFGLSSIAQISVLKGPQGTLFGRNATGGVIQVTTIDPGDLPTFKADFGVGNYATWQVHAFGSTPIGDSVRSSIAIASTRQQDGWGRNIATGREIFDRSEFSAQNKNIIELGSRTELTSNIFYARSKSYVGTTLGILPGALANDGRTRYISEYVVTPGADTPITVEQVISSLALSHDLGWAKLRLMGSYQHYTDQLTLVQNGIPLGSGRAVIFVEGDKADTYTSELTLGSPEGQDFQWTAGLFYFEDKTSTSLTLSRDTALAFRLNSTQSSKSYAVFAQVTKTILPRTQLTLGARYSVDEKGLVAQQTAPSGVTIATYASIAADKGYPLTKTWKKPTFRASLDHHVTDDLMLFASFNRGFKSGVFNLVTLDNRPAEPETINAYEIGAKSELFDRRLRLNVSGFLYDYDNLQLRTVLPPSSNFILYNAAQARVKGIDVDFQAVVTSRLNITGGFELLDAKYRSFPRAACTQPQTAGGNVTVTCDLAGHRMLRAPKFTGNIGFQYEVPLAGDGQILLTANDNYNSGFNWEAGGRLKQKSYHSVSASLKWKPSDSDYYVRIWGANLANERIRTVVGENASDVYSPGEPRTYGITFGVEL